MFKLGQKLICVNEKDREDVLELDKIYTFSHYNVWGEVILIQFGSDYSFYSGRFVDAEKYLYNQYFHDELAKIIEE